VILETVLPVDADLVLMRKAWSLKREKEKRHISDRMNNENEGKILLVGDSVSRDDNSANGDIRVDGSLRTLL
jgi:hypothetical protein